MSGAETMRAAIVHGGAGIDAVELRRVPKPQPGPGEALVRIVAATLNFRDLIMVDGLVPGLAKLPDLVPLSCAAGVVESVGDGVVRVAPGDRVSPLCAQGWIDGPPDPARMLGGSMDGVACDYAVFEAESLCRLPDELGDLEAAAVPCASVTAWNALFGARPLRAGEWALVQGTGGVATAALQLAKAAGGHVIVLSSSDAKLARARALGADIAINHRAVPDWAAAARAARGGAGVHIVVDVLGLGAFDRSASLLEEDGALAAIGMLDGPFSWQRSDAAGRPIMPIGVGNRAAHEAVLAFTARHGIRPVIDAVYELDRLPDALRRLKDGRFFGKIAIGLA